MNLNVSRFETSPSLEAELTAAAYRYLGGRRRKQRLVRTIAIAVLSALAIGGAAFAGQRMFGAPAPAQVREDLRGVDAGLPADLRVNPDVEHARSVAGANDSVLYLADLSDGGYCTEIVVDNVPRGAVCKTAAMGAGLPIDITIPSADPASEAGPLTVAGRVNVQEAVALRIHYGAGSDDRAPLGDDRFFVYEIPASRIADAHAGFVVQALDDSGNQVAANDLTSVFNEGEHEPSPIEAMTATKNGDLSVITRISGTINDPRIATLQLTYPDGHEDPVEIANGHFDIEIPVRFQADFMTPGRITGRDASGAEVESVGVAAPAYWTGRERSGHM